MFSVRLAKSVGNRVSSTKLPSIHLNSRFMCSNQFSFSFSFRFLILFAPSVHATVPPCYSQFKLEYRTKMHREKNQFQINEKRKRCKKKPIGTHVASAEPFSYNFASNSSCVNWNQYYTNCSQLGGNPFQSTISFDNIGMVTIWHFTVLSFLPHAQRGEQEEGSS